MKNVILIALGVVGGYLFAKRKCGCTDAHNTGVVPPGYTGGATAPIHTLDEGGAGLSLAGVDVAGGDPFDDPEAFGTASPPASFTFKGGGQEVTDTKISTGLRFRADGINGVCLGCDDRPRASTSVLPKALWLS